MAEQRRKDPIGRDVTRGLVAATAVAFSLFGCSGSSAAENKQPERARAEVLAARPAGAAEAAAPVPKPKPLAKVAVVVDDDSPGCTKHGQWNPSTRDKGFEGAGYVWCGKGAGAAKAVFTPDLPAAGAYAVFARWVASKPSDRAANAPFTVTFAGGTQTVRVDMSNLRLAGQWNPLGTYPFQAGKAGSVTLSNDSDNSVVADAVRFVMVSEKKRPAEKLVIDEKFDKDLSDWQSEGPNLVEVAGGRLHVKTAEGKDGQYVWCRKPLPADFRVEFDVTPVSKSGFFLIFFCATGTGGEDILGEKLFKQYTELKDFKKYTVGPINCYHISYRRNRQANCNLRKNTGKHLLKQSELDALLPEGEVARVVLTKQGGLIRLAVNDQVFMDFHDDGKINNEIYGAGRFGLRQVYDSEGHYDNFKVYDLTPSE